MILVFLCWGRAESYTWYLHEDHQSSLACSITAYYEDHSWFHGAEQMFLPWQLKLMQTRNHKLIFLSPFNSTKALTNFRANKWLAQTSNLGSREAKLTITKYSYTKQTETRAHWQGLLDHYFRCINGPRWGPWIRM